MIPIIERYIQEHISNWPIEIQQPLHLKPLLRSNKEADGIVKSEWIGKLIFWFVGENSSPCLVTKIMDSSLNLESIKSCIAIHESINEKISYEVFPKIFDIAEISGNIVLFQEAVPGPNYEIELSRAIYGPERSLSLTKQIIKRQLNEMGSLLKCLQDMRTSNEPQQWGAWAYKTGQYFRSNCGFNASCLTDANLDEMRSAIDSLPVYQHLVLVEDHIANYLPGPRAVDQIHPNIDELLSQRPAIIDVFRIIIAYFRAGPIAGLLSDWLYAIAAAISDKEERTIIGPPVRDLLRQVGLDLEQPKVIWAFVMVTFFIRANNELEFHSENPLVIDSLKAHFQRQIKRLLEIQELINRNKKFDLRPVIFAQNSLRVQSPLVSSSDLKKAVLTLFPSFMRPGLIKLYRAVYPKLSSVLYMSKIGQYLTQGKRI